QGPLETSARSLGLQPNSSPVHNTSEIESAITALAREPGGGLIMMPDTFNIVHRERIIGLAGQNKLPAISPYRFVVAEGGLISYGLDLVDLFRRAGGYVDRILRGAKPAELPVQAPTRYETTLNLKTAKALGLTIPDKLLVAADEVFGMMGWMAPLRHLSAKLLSDRNSSEWEPSMGEVTTIGLDLAKHVFQVHGVDAEGATVLRKQLRRVQVLAFFSRLPPCLVGLEACATAHYWARELRALGHEVRLMPAQYVKAYIKRNKHDAADAEAICEAV